MSWRGSVYTRGKKLWVRVKIDGKWTDRPTPFYEGQEKNAHALLAKMRDQIEAGATLEAGPLTVERWAKKWMESRKLLVPDWQSDDSHLRHHILPSIGSLRLDEVRPRHLADMVGRLRQKNKAPRTVRNIYSTVRSMFRDAAMQDRVTASPCILTKSVIGKIHDKNPEWRPSAVYSREEVELLISDERLSEDRHVLYGILAFTGTRYGEAAGLRWRHLDMDAKPLGRAAITTSYDSGRTKTGVERRAPIHRTLAVILAEWKLSGWAAMMKRQPGPDDIVVPRPCGLMHSKTTIGHRLAHDLKLFGFRHRRGHDLRSTFVSLAREDGAEPSVLRLVTHAPSRDMLDLYTRTSWERLCTEVGKLRIERRKPANVLPFNPEPCCSPAAVDPESLRPSDENGGGAGNRTRVQKNLRQSTTSVSL